MVSSKSFALLALSGLALAKPHGHQHQHVARHHRGPRGTGGVRPTGGFFPGGNGTWHDAPFPTGGHGAGSVPVLTQTVSALPGVPTGAEGAAPPAGGANIPDASAPPTNNNQQAPAPPADKPVADATNPVGGGQGAGSPLAGNNGGSGSGSPPANNAGGSGSPPAGNAGGSGSGSPPLGGSGGEQCGSTITITQEQTVTVTGGAGSPATPPAENKGASLTNVQQPSAGEFYGRPTGGFGQGQGQHGGYGGQGQGQSSAVPTTFATMPAGGNGGYGAPSATSGFGAAPSSGSGSGSGTPPSTGSGNNGSSGGSTGGGKRGLSFNDAGLLTPFDGTGMTWAYNWAETESGSLPAGVEFVPMCWGEDSIATCTQAAAGAKHVLSFNEPDLGEQADMTPEQAAQGHIKALNPLAAQGSLIGSPAITNGGAPMGTAWLDNWFKACGGQCKVDFVACHWYDNANNIAYFKQHINDVIQTAEANGVSKIWVTEFGVTGGDAASFITEATAFLDATPQVERYAYFMAAQGNLINGNALSAAGKAYAGQS